MYRQNTNNFNRIMRKSINSKKPKILNSNRSNRIMNNKTTGKTNKKLGYIFVVVLIVVIIGMVVYVQMLASNKNIFDWNPDVEDNEKLNRTQKRGTLISIAIMVSAIVQALMKKLGASQTMLLLLYGFFMAVVIGFMGDQALEEMKDLV